MLGRDEHGGTFQEEVPPTPQHRADTLAALAQDNLKFVESVLAGFCSAEQWAPETSRVRHVLSELVALAHDHAAYAAKFSQAHDEWTEQRERAERAEAEASAVRKSNEVLRDQLATAEADNARLRERVKYLEAALNHPEKEVARLREALREIAGRGEYFTLREIAGRGEYFTASGRRHPQNASVLAYLARAALAGGQADKDTTP